LLSGRGCACAAGIPTAAPAATAADPASRLRRDVVIDSRRRLTTTITDWGSISRLDDGVPTRPMDGTLAANGYLVAVSVALLLGCVVVGVMAAGRAATPRIRHLAAVTLAAAAAFTACTALTVFLQVHSWGPLLGFSGPQGPSPLKFYGVGLWVLLLGAALVVTAAVYAALPVRTREPGPTVPAPEGA
jgi:hypothetical protein